MRMPAHHRHHYGDDGYDDDDDDDDHDHDDDGFFLFLHHIFVRFTSCQVYLSVRFTSLVQATPLGRLFSYSRSFGIRPSSILLKAACPAMLGTFGHGFFRFFGPPLCLEPITL